MVIYNAYSPRKNEASPAGNPIVSEFVRMARSDGSFYLEKVGEHNIQEVIDSFKESCDLKTNIAKLLGGDPTAHVRDGGFYADITGCPKHLCEVPVFADKILDQAAEVKAAQKVAAEIAAKKESEVKVVESV